MKKLLPLLLLLIPLAANADVTLEKELAYSALHLIDWAQTRQIAAQPDKWLELNPLLGQHPSRAKVNIIFFVSF